jgi:hypothetical protein
MVRVVIIGDQKFYRDAARTRAGTPHYILDAVGDITQTIASLARRFAPGSLGLESIGTEPAVAAGNIYRAMVGVRDTPKHAKFVHGGTGVFGPLHRPYTITKKQTHFAPDWGIDRTGRMNPAVGNVFKITSGHGEIYFRRQVTIMGQRPQPYLIEAFDLAKRSEVPLRVRHLARQLVRS